MSTGDVLLQLLSNTHIEKKTNYVFHNILVLKFKN